MAEHYGFSQSTTTSADLKLLKKLFTQLHQSKHDTDLKLWSKHTEKNTDPNTPIQALWSKHADPPQALIHSLCLRWYVRVWVCLVLWCLWLILWLIFYFVCGSLCIRGRSKWWWHWFCRWRGERKKGAKLEITKIMYKSYNNWVCIHGYYSSCIFMHNFTPTDVGVFWMKMCKKSCFLYFAKLSMD